MSQTMPATSSTFAHCRTAVTFTTVRLRQSLRKQLGSASRQSEVLGRRAHSVVAYAVAAEDQKRESAATAKQQAPIQFEGVHHVGFIIEDKEISRTFYCDTLGLSINEDRPNDKLSFDGLWLWLGPEMLHLMVVPDPDPKTGRPDHGGRDRHVCLGVTDLTPVEDRLEAGGVEYTKSKSGRRAVFFRDPDMNCLEIFESKPWR